ncbi:hypothetical protein ACFTZK_01465 [Streptomyces decoyicus]|uniref:hypothetical protein n=1 Tax=Streptomyces decoyicus TaxID=249567 RepID=UPI00363A4295
MTAGTRNDCTQAKAVISPIRVPAGSGQAPDPARTHRRGQGLLVPHLPRLLRRPGIKATGPERTDQLAGRARRRERLAGSTRPSTGAATSSNVASTGFKQWRGIATRYDTPGRYLAEITLASTLIWLDQ